MKLPYKYIIVLTAGVVAYGVYYFSKKEKQKPGLNNTGTNNSNTIIPIQGIINDILPTGSANNDQVVVLGSYSWNQNYPQSPLSPQPTNNR